MLNRIQEAEMSTPAIGERNQSATIKSSDPARSSPAVLAIFAETNNHLRNAEQKQLTVTGAYLAMVAVAASRGAGVFKAQPEGAVLFLVMIFVGCGVFVVQAWCRVWKEHYLSILNAIAKTWQLDETLLPYWLRDEPALPRRAFMHVNVDNTLVYLTFILNTALVVEVCRQAFGLLVPRAAWVSSAALILMYILLLAGVNKLIRNRRDELIP
jgi:hypothetical protein